MPRLALFGRPVLTGAGDVIVSGRPAQRHCLALLALLAGERRGLGRDRLLAYLWPESDGLAARHRLSVALHLLRQQLGAGCIVSAGDALLLDADQWQVDVREFEDRGGRGDFAGALACCRGALLDGFYLRGAPDFERWLEGWRVRVARRQLAMLHTLADAAESGGDREVALEYRQEIVARDPCTSSGTLALMRALAAAGRPEQAIGHGRAYTLLVREEYDLEPDPAVAACAAGIARDRGQAPAALN